jgi:hypothetical protein
LLRPAPARGAHLLMSLLGEAVEPSGVASVTPRWRGVDRSGEALIVPQRWPKALPFPIERGARPMRVRWRTVTTGFASAQSLGRKRLTVTVMADLPCATTALEAER